MLRNVTTTQSECSRESDKQRMFSAVRALDGGLSALDRCVLCSVVEWLQLQLQHRVHQATDDRRTGWSLMPARRCSHSLVYSRSRRGKCAFSRCSSDVLQRARLPSAPATKYEREKNKR
jgi:hypothetical protein